MIIGRMESPQDSDPDHRIANNLSMVSATLRMKTRRLQQLGGHKAREILEDTAFQIDTVATLHKLSNRGRGTRVDLDQYLASVCNAAGPALSTRGRITPEYKLNCNYSAAPEFALSVGLAVAELLTNAFRHAHPAADTGKVAVHTSRRGAVLIIEVSDDGVGLPIGYHPGSGEAIGLRLVQQTAARWEGNVEFHDCKPGLCVRLELLVEPGPERPDP